MKIQFFSFATFKKKPKKLKQTKSFRFRGFHVFRNSKRLNIQSSYSFQFFRIIRQFIKSRSYLRTPSTTTHCIHPSRPSYLRTPSHKTHHVIDPSPCQGQSYLCTPFHKNLFYKPLTIDWTTMYDMQFVNQCSLLLHLALMYITLPCTTSPVCIPPSSTFIWNSTLSESR